MSVETTLDFGGTVPLHHQLAEAIRERIRSGELRPGEPLPSERELCGQIGLSRGTVRQALLSLIYEGLAYTERGKGNFVAPHKIDQTLLSLPSVVMSLRRGGHHVVTKPLGVFTVPASPSIAKRLAISEGATVVKARRLRLINNEPFLISTSVVPESRCPQFAFDESEGQTVYELIERKYGIEVARIKSTLETTVLDEFEADLLAVQHSLPAFRLERIAVSSDGQPVAFTVHIIRGDRCQFSFEVDSNVMAPAGVLRN